MIKVEIIRARGGTMADIGLLQKEVNSFLAMKNIRLVAINFWGTSDEDNYKNSQYCAITYEEKQWAQSNFPIITPSSLPG